MGYLITIKGIAETDHYDLSELDGVMCDDDFAEYFNEEEQALIDKNVNNGYMRFSHENGELYTITEYECEEKLTDDELQILADYTQGQWSDGIGEGFEQFPCFFTEDEEGEEVEVYISPWCPKQKITITQVFL